MSQPEWEDLQLCADDFADENNFYKNSANFGEYVRPPWYYSESVFPMRPVPQDDQIITAQSPTTSTRLSFFRNSLILARKILPLPIKQRMYGYMNLVNSFVSLQLDSRQRIIYREFRRRIELKVRKLEEESARYGTDWQITKNMMMRYKPHAWWLHRYAEKFSVLFAYIYAPIYAMLLDSRPYISVEIGTIREIPFDGTDIGKMLAMAYRKAHHVLITNPDATTQADKLGIRGYTFCPHPLDEDIFRPVTGGSVFREGLAKQYNADSIMFAPARQNWRLKGNDRYLKAFASFVKDGNKSVLIIPAWGQEIRESKELCKELNINDNVVWIAPQSEKALVKYYQAADIVLDQFTLGVFGLITPKAMACGAVVLTSYNTELHKWCYREDPPVVGCATEKEIYEAMRRIIHDKSRKAELSAASRDWICRYNSKQKIRNILDGVTEKAIERFSAERRRNNNSVEKYGI